MLQAKEEDDLKSGFFFQLGCWLDTNVLEQNALNKNYL